MLENPVRMSHDRMHPSASSFDDSGYVNEKAHAEHKEHHSAQSGDSSSYDNSNTSGSSSQQQREEPRTYRRYADYDDGGGTDSNQTHQAKQNRKIHERWFTLLKSHNLSDSDKKKFRMATKLEEEEKAMTARRARMDEYQRVLDYRRERSLNADAPTDRETSSGGDSSDVRVSIRPRAAGEDSGRGERYQRENREDIFWHENARQRDKQHTLDLEVERKLYEAASRMAELKERRDAEFTAKGETSQERADRLVKENIERKRDEAREKAVDMLVKAERRIRFGVDYGSLFFMQHLTLAGEMIDDAEELLVKYDLMTPQLIEDLESLRSDRYDMVYKLDLEGQHVEMD